MSARRSVVIPTLSHLTAIPVATRIGPLVVSSVIAAFDPGTRNVPEGVEAQLTNIFDHVDAMLREAGAAWGDVAKMSFWLADPSHRAALEAPWTERFADAGSRPSRHTHITRGAPMATADFIAYVAD